MPCIYAPWTYHDTFAAQHAGADIFQYGVISTAQCKHYLAEIHGGKVAGAT